MTASLVKVMEQRLVRGAKVVVAESFDKPKLRGKTLVVASKNTVPCKGGGRCAGKWCIGLAVFVANERTFKKDKALAWRTGAHKICLTHLKDEEGELLISPTAVSIAQEAFEEPEVVTWEDLANAAADQDVHRLIGLARSLKQENEHLARRVIEVQDRLIAQLE